MRRPLIQRPKRSDAIRPRERGVTMALVAVSMFSLVAMAALSIDLGTLFEARSEAQRSANAAALAGARFISTSGLMGDPTNASVTWAKTCTNAALVAQAVANQTTVGGSVPTSLVTYSADNASSSSGNPDCSTLGSGFAVDAVVTVKVSRANLPTYFSRIWGRTGSSVSATATAEAFNPSGSDAYASSGGVVPVQPRCVKPWFVPNYDPPPSPSQCGSPPNPACKTLVATANGAISQQGILALGGGVIGEEFWLIPDCRKNGGTNCVLRSNPPIANRPSPAPLPNVEYLPGQVARPSAAVPSGCSNVTNNYAQAIAGCDQTTPYQCGVQLGNTVDLSENPDAPNGDTLNGVQCLIHQNGAGGGTGQDSLAPGAGPYSYPFQIQAGSSNPLVPKSATAGDTITSSTSIVSIPIYDTASPTSPPTFTSGTQTTVTIVGFLQVFINSVNNNGDVDVTVMNVSGCGNGLGGATVSSPPLYGTSPVPVRLVTPP